VRSVAPAQAGSSGQRRALWLLGFTIAYNLAEGVIAVWFGREAGSDALVAFGLDSAIECAAAAVLSWRVAVEFRGADEERTEAAERPVRLLGVGAHSLKAVEVPSPP